MEIVSREETKEIQIFLAQYYAFENFEVGVGLLKEKEWKAFGRLIQDFRKWQDEWFLRDVESVESEAKGVSIVIHEPEVYTHAGAIRGSPWEEVGGYECQAVPLSMFLKTCAIESSAKKAFTRFLDGTRFAIFLRERELPDRFNRLVGVFHELLHTIEQTVGKPIYRGDTPQQEAKDEKEIVEPLVRLFIRTRDATSLARL
jgi:hypothetical protein